MAARSVAVGLLRGPRPSLPVAAFFAASEALPTGPRPSNRPSSAPMAARSVAVAMIDRG